MCVLWDALSGQREHLVPVPRMFGPSWEESEMQGSVREVHVP